MLLFCIYVYVGKRRSVEMQKKLEAVELYNELKRYREERKLIIAEMKNLLNYYHQCVLPAISEDIKGISKMHYIVCMCLDDTRFYTY